MLYDPATDSFVRGGEGVTTIENQLGILHMNQSQAIGSGPEGRSVRLIFALQPKAPLAGQQYQIELLASDDNGHSQVLMRLGS